LESSTNISRLAETMGLIFKGNCFEEVGSSVGSRAETNFLPCRSILDKLETKYLTS
jgi:hypothetical protein